MNAVVLMIVGEKYERLYERKKYMFKNFAMRCNAELILHTNPPDGSRYRSILAQKLLLPSIYRTYQKILFLDLDIFISQEAPNPFNLLKPKVGCMAVVDPRYQLEFREAWSRLPEALSEDHDTYFTRRGFPVPSNLYGSINGGVMLFRPAIVAELFSDYYYSKHTESYGVTHEEAPIAYLSQANDVFEPLHYCWNAQFLYSLYSQKSGKPLILNRLKNHLVANFLRAPSGSNRLVYQLKCRLSASHIKRQMNNAYIVHMASGFPSDFPNPLTPHAM